MRRRRSLPTGLAILATFAAFVTLPTPTAFADSTTETYIVQLKKGVSADAVIPKLLGSGAEVLDKVGAGVADITSSEAASLANSPYVKSVTKDAVVKAADTQVGAPWDLDKLDSATGTIDGNYVYPNNGSGVTVYVVDSGIVRTQSEFASANFQAGINFVVNVDPESTCGKAQIKAGASADLSVNPSNTTDQGGHGTAVASLVAGATVGVAKGATIVPVRVLDCDGQGTESDIMAAANWILRDHQAGAPAVVNFSLGAPGDGLDSTVQTLIDAGLTVVAAAGNENADACNTTPARAPSAITVAATSKSNTEPLYFDQTGKLIWGTNYGSCVDLYAPGDGVFVANYKGRLALGSGTSFSAPLTSGAVALVLHDHPTWTPAQVSANLLDQAVDGVVIGPGGLPARSANKLLHVEGRFVGTDPTITGALYVGETLHATLHWTPTPTTVTYKWSRNGVEIVGATNESYVTTTDDLGQSLTVAVAASGVGYYDISGTSAPVVPAAPPDPGMVVTMTPSRLMDSRTGLGATAPLRNGQTVTIPVAGVGDIMSTASAVLVNITVTDATTEGFVTAYASGGAMPATSNGNFQVGKVSATLALVPVGADGAIALSVGLGGTVQLVVDVQSYIAGGAVTEAGAVVPVTPTRLVDTRNNAAVGPYDVLPVKVTGGVAGVPADATAVFVNVTVAEPQTSGYLAVYPSGDSIPATSNLNFVKNLTVPNLALVKVGGDGMISIQNAGPGTAQVIVDIQGYVVAGTPTARGAVVPISPTRILDTRIGLGAKGPVAARTGVVVTIAGDSVPTGTEGIFMNFTVTEPQTGGWLAAYPTQATPPLVSNLNFVGGQTVPNLATVGLTNAQATLFNGSWGSVQMVADVFAYIL